MQWGTREQLQGGSRSTRGMLLTRTEQVRRRSLFVIVLVVVRRSSLSLSSSVVHRSSLSLSSSVGVLALLSSSVGVLALSSSVVHRSSLSLLSSVVHRRCCPSGRSLVCLLVVVRRSFIA